jgi:hypothetical protein
MYVSKQRELMHDAHLKKSAELCARIMPKPTPQPLSDQLRR